MNFQQFLLILKARRKVLRNTLLVTVLTTLVLSLVWPKSYTATTAIVLDQKPDPISGIAMAMGGLQSFTYQSTQIEIIQSERVAGKVVKAFRLDEDPKFIEDWKWDTKGRGDIVVWIARLLLKKLDVRPERDSNVIDIEYTARDPKIAAAIANRFAEAYVDTSLELKIEPARQYASWYVERTKSMRADLEKAQSRLSEGQREKGIVAVDERLDVENARLADLSAQLTVIQAQTADTLSRQAQARGDKAILPEVLQSGLVQNLKAEIARSEAKLQEMAGQLGKNHPQYKRSEMELQSLRQKLDLESGQVAFSIGTSTRVNQQREAEIKSALDAQKAKVLQLKRQRDEIAVMQRDVEGAQRAYDSVIQRLNQSSLESQANQTNVAILHPATEPVDPSRPRLWLNLFLSVFVGVLLGVLLALRREMIDYRIRVIEDVTELLKLPVLGIIEKPPLAPDARRGPLWGWWRRAGLALGKS
jgi:polysaccharide biosynthesis transport protein